MMVPLASGTQVVPLCPLPVGSMQSQGHAAALRPLQRRAGLRQPRSRPAGSRMALKAQASGEASVRQDETMALPLDYYKLLGVSAVSSRDNLAKALEKCACRCRRLPGLSAQRCVCGSPVRTIYAYLHVIHLVPLPHHVSHKTPPHPTPAACLSAGLCCHPPASATASSACWGAAQL